ncbi:MAG: competence/damage-inducible protein A [Candidatus Nitronauta litoralis]|uniref:CinA-like protein n=1 Tax=Candidatus Nitronauta litoralis TaxID=2705533 RepID=A0A7T0BXH3_9BACT|nr:MAG: competence/damage-inducible protein A [Candidatus Nitronauta litoralis]
MNNLQAEILTIGNEVISGLIQDTNARKLASRLNEIGVWVSRFTSIGDDRAAILEEIKRILSRSDILIITGGLGATHDDITKAVLAEYFEQPLVHNERVHSMVESFFKKRGKPIKDRILSQAEVPEGATVLFNEKGTAPGFLFKDGNRKVFALPGVPLEMEHLLETWVVPELEGEGKSTIVHRVLNTTGISESALWDKTGPVADFEKGVSIASLPSHLGVRIRLTAKGNTKETLVADLDRAEASLRDCLQHYIYSVDGETLEEVVGGLLRERKYTLATAESCTGGLISSRITRVPGSSDYFKEGAVTYSNQAKMERLSVPSKILDDHGAVSEPVAAAMARGIRLASDSDIAVSVTGIAGPGGGSADKPVGLTFIAVSDKEGEFVEQHVFHQDRGRNQDRAAQAALNLVRLRLSGEKLE